MAFTIVDPRRLCSRGGERNFRRWRGFGCTISPRTGKRSGGLRTKTVGYLGWKTAPLPAAPGLTRKPIRFRLAYQHCPSPRPGSPHSLIPLTTFPVAQTHHDVTVTGSRHQKQCMVGEKERYFVVCCSMNKLRYTRWLTFRVVVTFTYHS